MEVSSPRPSRFAEGAGSWRRAWERQAAGACEGRDALLAARSLRTMPFGEEVGSVVEWSAHDLLGIAEALAGEAEHGGPIQESVDGGDGAGFRGEE